MSIYEDVVKEPYEKNNAMWYEANFRNLSQLQLFLQSNPDINTEVFSDNQSELASEYGRPSFAGEPYEKAVEYLMIGYDENYQEFLSLRKELTNAMMIEAPRRRIVKSQVGTRVHMPNFVANKPKSMLRLEPAPVKKFITVNFCLGYSAAHNKAQIKNRGILTLNLIKILEMNGYTVKLNAFKLNRCFDEYLYIKIKLKAPNEILDEKKCYFPFCGVEFSRRILFRILEVMPVCELDWSDGYGTPVRASDASNLLNIPKNDIIIGQPDEMGIDGFNIYDDANRFFQNLNLNDEIKIRKLSRK